MLTSLFVLLLPYIIQTTLQDIVRPSINTSIFLPQIFPPRHTTRSPFLIPFPGFPRWPDLFTLRPLPTLRPPLTIKPVTLPPIITTAPTNLSRPCNQNELWNQCGGCDRTCKEPNPQCPLICQAKCICQDTFIRDCDGNCVPWWHCLYPQPGN
ncbi:hypothetical protein L596_013387 [Steinernema carpocapsae]|uniref:TIL domain-containing protein n=1 Tax=Steinernema carpocapsae TaxID=34508 RepID=A0A4U5P055_STECR|nr:hypothetical protein L596_013387 [Steinernema carpocapsae]